MTALVLTSENLQTIKRGLVRALPHCGSSHLSEALASALGFRSNAALLARMEKMTEDNFQEFALLDDKALKERLIELNDNVKGFKPNIFNRLGIEENGTILVNTAPASATKFKYQSKRGRAWRNMMVAGINAALDKKLISLMPGDNRWPEAQQKSLDGRRYGHSYSFVFGDDIPAVGYVNDAGWDEITIHVALWPTEDGERRVKSINAGSLAGEAFAKGWLERRRGVWLQSSTKLFYSRKVRVEKIASAVIDPCGFGDRGHVVM